MNLYEVGDTVYLKINAEKGNVDAVIIKTVNIIKFDPNFPIIKYKASGIFQFKNTIYFENDFIDLITAKTIATTFLNSEIAKIQTKITTISTL